MRAKFIGFKHFDVSVVIMYCVVPHASFTQYIQKAI